MKFNLNLDLFQSKKCLKDNLCKEEYLKIDIDSDCK